MKKSRYIDPTTQSYAIRAGNYVRVSAIIGWVYNMLMLHRGTVPGAEDLGSELHLIQHTGPNVTGEIKAAIEQALFPGLGIRFLAYEVYCWLQGGQPITAIVITVRAGDRPYVITYRPWTDDDATLGTSPGDGRGMEIGMGG